MIYFCTTSAEKPQFPMLPDMLDVFRWAHRNAGLAGTWKVTQPSCCTEAKTIPEVCLPAVIANLFPRDSLTSLFAFRDSQGLWLGSAAWCPSHTTSATNPVGFRAVHALSITPWSCALCPTPLLGPNNSSWPLSHLHIRWPWALSSIFVDFARLCWTGTFKILPKSLRSNVGRCWRICKSQWPCGVIHFLGVLTLI